MFQAKFFSCGSNLLDNQASASVFRDIDLLTDVLQCDKPSVISGFSSEPDAVISASKIGNFREFNNVYYCPDATANILSFSELQIYCTMRYDDEKNIFECKPPNGPQYIFSAERGLYVHYSSQNTVNVTVLSENKSKFSQRQVAEASKAKDLSRALGYPSPSSLIDMINAGSIINCPVSARNIADARLYLAQISDRSVARPRE